MIVKSSKNAQTVRKRKRRRVSLLYLAILLLTLWLIVCLALGFLFIKGSANDNPGLNSLDSKSLSVKDKSKFYFELLKSSDEAAVSSDTFPSIEADSEALLTSPSRDEFRPTMENLFKERDLSKENIEKLFTNIKSIKELNPMHSTFGKEVVYIYHSHSREAFLPYLKNVNKPEEAYHSEVNITLVGKMFEEALERRGLGTTVDTTDIVQELDRRGLNYGSSYPVSGELLQSAQKKNKDLEIFLDVHRDSLRRDSTTVEMAGEDHARLLFVVGTGHKNFEKNLAFTEGLQNQLASQYPGLSKGILKKDGSQGNGIYNQNLSPKSVIVEIGGVDNTAGELSRTVEALAEVLSDYYWHGEK